MASECDFVFGLVNLQEGLFSFAYANTTLEVDPNSKIEGFLFIGTIWKCYLCLSTTLENLTSEIAPKK